MLMVDKKLVLRAVLLQIVACFFFACSAPSIENSRSSGGSSRDDNERSDNSELKHNSDESSNDSEESNNKGKGKPGDDLEGVPGYLADIEKITFSSRSEMPRQLIGKLEGGKGAVAAIPGQETNKVVLEVYALSNKEILTLDTLQIAAEFPSAVLLKTLNPDSDGAFQSEFDIPAHSGVVLQVKNSKGPLSVDLSKIANFEDVLVYPSRGDEVYAFNKDVVDEIKSLIPYAFDFSTSLDSVGNPFIVGEAQFNSVYLQYNISPTIRSNSCRIENKDGVVDLQFYNCSCMPFDGKCTWIFGISHSGTVSFDYVLENMYGTSNLGRATLTVP